MRSVHQQNLDCTAYWLLWHQTAQISRQFVSQCLTWKQNCVVYKKEDHKSAQFIKLQLSQQCYQHYGHIISALNALNPMMIHWDIQNTVTNNTTSLHSLHTGSSWSRKQLAQVTDSNNVRVYRNQTLAVCVIYHYHYHHYYCYYNTHIIAINLLTSNKC